MIHVSYRTQFLFDSMLSLSEKMGRVWSCPAKAWKLEPLEPPKVMEVDGSDDFRELWCIFLLQNVKPNEPRKKKTSYFPLYWLVNRDPYNGLL